MSEGGGLYYLRARYYDSRTARFLSRDPILSRDPRRVNPYQYAAGDPNSLGDPTGLDPSDGYIQWRGGALLETALRAPGRFNGYSWGGSSMSGLTYRESAGLLDGIGAAKTFQAGIDHPLSKTGLGYQATVTEQFMPPTTAMANVFDPSAFKSVNYGAPTVKAAYSLRYDAVPDYSGFRVTTGAFDQEGSYGGIFTPKTYPVNIPTHFEKLFCCFETDGMLGCLERSTYSCRFGPAPPYDFYRPEQRLPGHVFNRYSLLGSGGSF
ncbi:MAG: hypothetical protein EXS36_12315 [Pedosphaera sp.]|nr:hypothetical protein [Pedosphaera sp.]